MYIFWVSRLRFMEKVATSILGFVILLFAFQVNDLTKHPKQVLTLFILQLTN